MMEKPCHIYARKLWPLRHGHPLWIPDSKTGEVFVGDVGWIREGEFRALFNSLEDALDPINYHRGVPSGFRPLNPPNLVIHGPEIVLQSKFITDGDSKIYGMNARNHRSAVIQVFYYS